jgi:hypothetical protein
MYIHPRRIKEHLFARYTSVYAKGINDDEDEDITVPGENETIFTNFSERDTLPDQPFIVPVIKAYKSLERLPSTIDHSDEFQIIPTMIRSSHSCSDLTAESTIRFDTNYAFTLDETKHQTEARKIIKTQPPTPSLTDESHIISTKSIAATTNVNENLGKKNKMFISLIKINLFKNHLPMKNSKNPTKNLNIFVKQNAHHFTNKLLLLVVHI